MEKNKIINYKYLCLKWVGHRRRKSCRCLITACSRENLSKNMLRVGTIIRHSRVRRDNCTKLGLYCILQVIQVLSVLTFLGSVIVHTMYHNNNAYIETKYTHYLSKNQAFLLQFFENLCFLSKIHRPMVWKNRLIGKPMNFSLQPRSSSMNICLLYVD